MACPWADRAWGQCGAVPGRLCAQRAWAGSTRNPQGLASGLLVHVEKLHLRAMSGQSRGRWLRASERAVKKYPLPAEQHRLPVVCTSDVQRPAQLQNLEAEVTHHQGQERLCQGLGWHRAAGGKQALGGTS